ncbi:phage regulatory CII family protein [Pseudomonas petrae]|uniref:Rha family transcriptional regulator n=1 Tax=Pseudomonas petrae TaxID=2912190 RepID=A0ABS9IC46_9PSED|nr:phage regulatory CII family protein [Pseudomonas petrae]MCF7545292.1 Rha family transcriptional regulator [Pseudomonas petrae]
MARSHIKKFEVLGMQDFLRACDAVVEEADTKNLATLMSLPPVSLLQRANANYDGAWFNVKHLYALLLHTQDMRPLEALAGEFGYVIVKLEAPAPIDLHQALGKVAFEISQLTIETHGALSDGRVDQIERARILREVDHAEKALALLKASVKVA